MAAVRALVRGIAPYLAVLALALVVHLLAGSAADPQFRFYAKVAMDCAIAVTLAVSLNLVNGFTGQFSIGHAGFMAVGAYASAAVTYYGSLLLWGSEQARGGVLSSSQALGADGAAAWFTAGDLLFLGALLVGGLVAALFGLLVGLPSLRLRGDYLAIVTLGFGEIVRVLVQRTDDVLVTVGEVREVPLPALATKLGGALGFTGIPFYTTLFWTLLAAGTTVVVAYRLKTSSLGRAYLAIREDEIAAEAMGVATTRYKVQAFVLSAFFAGVAGCLFAHQLGTTLNPRELGFMKSFDILIMVVLGGLGSISGTVLSAVSLTILPELLRTFANYRMVVYALLLIVVMLVRPQGLFGIRELWDLGWFKRLVRRRAAVGEAP